MSYIYYPSNTSILRAETLRNKYFVQLAPDGEHLVLGMLHQGTRPPTGNWLEVGKIDRTFPDRYFVMYTDFHTLVPGSLITADKLPQGKWKELKQQSDPMFYRVYITDNSLTHTPLNIPDYIMVNYSEDVLAPARFTYGHIHSIPSNNPASFDYKLYYYAGSFNELNNDPSKLTLFGSPGALFRIFDPMYSVYLDTFHSIIYESLWWFEIWGILPQGSYSFVLGILNSNNEIVEYIVLENAFRTLET